MDDLRARGTPMAGPRWVAQAVVMEQRSTVGCGKPGNFSTVHQWLFPPLCMLCGEAGEDGLDLCRECTAALPWLGNACPVCALPLPAAEVGVRCGRCRGARSALTFAHGAFRYEWPIDGLLRRFKFDGDLVAGRLLTQLMVRELGTAPFAQICSGSAMLVPIPLHAVRLRARGYDQAAELTRGLSHALRQPWCFALRRRVATQAQSALQATARRRNVHDVFESVAPVPHHVVLVDDVMTTGATLRSAARTLRGAGAGRVDAWVCARVP
jgi:ComF family protein